MLKAIADLHNISYRTVEDIYYHQFEFVVNQMESGEKGSFDTYEHILLKHFGSFVANEKHINKLNEITNANENKVT
jgi:hypothetical protein